jgi:AcrR family transcriptional regulator
MSSHRGRPRPNRHGRFGEVKPPIWARPEPRPRGRGAALSLEQIADVALAIADAEGLEAVSIRRIARELGSGAMSLYHYFDSRDELLDLMADRVAAEMLVPELPADWRPALRAIAHHSRATFRHHPWLHSALRGSPRLTPNLLRHIEQSSQTVARLAADGVDPALLSAIVVAVDDYTIGFTVREAAVEDPGNRAAGIADRLQEPHLRALLESGEFPLLSEFIEGGQDLQIEDRFERGLDWLLDGFAAQIGR